MSEKAKPRGLGRGLNALFEDDEELVSILSEDGDVTMPAGTSAPASGGSSKLGVEQLEPGLYQPRMDFEPEALNALAASIKVHGILQPLLVREKRDVITGDVIEGRYEIIAGERRWRAAQLAQLHEVPVVVRALADEQAMQIALIENLQREDLNPVEEALAYQRLIQDHEYTQNQLAEALGKSRSHIANMTRMLTLPEPVLDLVRSGDLSPGHVRALITFNNPLPLAEKILAEGMSVRAVERYVNGLNAAAGKPSGRAGKGGGKTATKAKAEKDPDIVALEKELSDNLGLRTMIEMQPGSQTEGVIGFTFRDLDQLDYVINLLKKGSQTFDDPESESPPAARLMD